MANYQFTLMVEGPDLQGDEIIEALFDAGCDDALVGQVDGVQYLDFDREAESIGAAVVSAIRSVERLEGVTALRLADAGLVSMAAIAERLGRTRESVRLLVSGARGPGGFPPPATDPRSHYRLWRWGEVQRWVRQHLEHDPADYRDDVLAVINARLELRAQERNLDAVRRAELADLLG